MIEVKKCSILFWEESTYSCFMCSTNSFLDGLVVAKKMTRIAKRTMENSSLCFFMASISMLKINYCANGVHERFIRNPLAWNTPISSTENLRIVGVLNNVLKGEPFFYSKKNRKHIVLFYCLSRFI